MDVFTLVSTIVIIASLTWSAGVLIFALFKMFLNKRKMKKLKQEVLQDDEKDSVK